jgi:hypothetical protein
MLTTAEYRMRAQAALESATLATDPVARAHFEMIAGQWLALANFGSVQEALGICLTPDLDPGTTSPLIADPPP